MFANAIWSIYFQIGKSAFNAGDAVTAKMMFSEAFDYASTHDLEPALVANSAFGLAVALLECPLEQERKKEAQQLLRKAIRIYERVQNLDCGLFVGCVSSLCDSYCQDSFPQRAIPVLKHAAKVIIRIEGIEAPNLVPLFRRMALIYSEKNYQDKAERYFRKAMAPS